MYYFFDIFIKGGEGNLPTAHVLEMSKDEELWESEDWYPPLCPPTRLKKEILRDEDFSYVDSKARRAPDRLKDSFRELITYLTNNLDSDLLKLRAIFMWMGAQEIRTEKVEANCTCVVSPRYYLKKAFSDKPFIGKLFAKLCREARIPCILVNGVAKAAGYQTGDDETGVRSIWAVVYVDSSWHFVFPHWAFVALNGYQKGNWIVIEDTKHHLRQRLADNDGTTVSRVAELWFLTDPDVMNCFCHPDDDDKQLLTQTWTEQEFYSLPHYQESYFSSGWNLCSPNECIIKASSGFCEIEFQPPTPDGKLNYKLLFNENLSGCPFPENIKTELYVSSHQKESGQRVSLIIRPPVKGKYQLQVIGVHGNDTHRLARFRIDCDFVPPCTRPFPSQPDIGFGYGKTAVRAGLSEPSHTDGLVPVTPGQEIDFTFKVHKGVGFSARLVHPSRPPEQLRDNVSVRRKEASATVKAKLPEDDPKPEYSLEIDITKTKEGTFRSDETGSSVVSYLLTSDETLKQTTMDKTKELKLQRKKIYDALAMELRDSTKERDLDRLDSAIRACIRDNLQNSEIEAAKRQLLLLCKDEVQKSLEERKLNELKQCLDKVTNTCVGELVKKETWFQDASDRREDLDILRKSNEKVQSMVTEEDIADLCKPLDKIVLDTIFAALILLGESQTELKTWKQILTKMNGLLAMMGSCKVCSLTPEQVDVAEERLNRHDWTSIDNKVANRLYTWCINMIRLHELRKKKQKRLWPH